MTSLSHSLQSCHDRHQLKLLAEQTLLHEFGGLLHRLFFFDESPIPPGLWQQVAELFLRSETATHEAQLMDNSTWRSLCPRADHGHVMIGPLLSDCRVVGALGVTREPQHAFDAPALERMNRLSLYFSNRLTQLDGQKDWAGDRLTPREREIAQLARDGMRNAEIADKLALSEYTVKQNLKAVFRKLQVRSRTELAGL